MPSRHENRVGGNFGGMFVLGLLLILVRKSVPGSTTWNVWWQWSWHRSIRIFIVLCIRGGCVGVMNICVVVGLGQPREPASAMHRGYCSSRALLVQPATYRSGIHLLLVSSSLTVLFRPVSKSAAEACLDTVGSSESP
jgi:hypothetical protein